MKWNDLMELKGAVADVFEEFLKRNGISIPNEERDKAEADGAEGCAIIYGDDYHNITIPIEALGVTFGLDAFDLDRDTKMSVEKSWAEPFLDKVWTEFLCVVRRSQDIMNALTALNREYASLKDKFRSIVYASGLIKREEFALSFHCVTDDLPDDQELKVVICRKQNGVLNWNRAYCSDGIWHGSGSMSGVIAWASLDAEDVVKNLGITPCVS